MSPSPRWGHQVTKNLRKQSFLRQHVRDGFLDDFQIARPAKTAEADRQLRAAVDLNRLAAFPADEIRPDDAKGAVIHLAIEDQPLEFSRLHARDPHLARF